MAYNISYTDEALEGAAMLRKSSPAGFRKLEKLVKELQEHPYTGTGHPEHLKHIPGDMWSRHIDKKNRLRYFVHDDIVEVLVVSVVSHYGDK